MLRVKWTETGTYADGGILKDGFENFVIARQYVQDTFLNEPEMAENILQVVKVSADGDEEVLVEYELNEFKDVE